MILISLRDDLKYVEQAKRNDFTDEQIRDKLSMEYSDTDIQKIFRTHYRGKIINFTIIFAFLFLGLVTFFMRAPESVGFVILGVDDYANNQLSFYGMIAILTVVCFTVVISIIALVNKIRNNRRF